MLSSKLHGVSNEASAARKDVMSRGQSIEHRANRQAVAAQREASKFKAIHETVPIGLHGVLLSASTTSRRRPT